MALQLPGRVAKAEDFTRRGFDIHLSLIHILAMMLAAPRSFRLLATSSMLSPEAMISSAIKTVLPSTLSPR